MSTVIIPHLDLVINMIEKNIFRPLPILKKAGLPGEGVGMEEVFTFYKKRNNFWWILLGHIYSQFTSFSYNLLSMMVLMLKLWKFILPHLSYKNSSNYLILNNQENVNTWKIFFIVFMPSLFQEEKWFVKPLTTVSTVSFMKHLNSMVPHNFWIFWPVSSQVLLYHSEKNILFSLKMSLYLCIKFKPVTYSMNIWWDVQCYF